MSTWPAVLRSSAIAKAQCSFSYPFLEWSLLNPGWSNFFASLQEHEKILPLRTSFFGTGSTKSFNWLFGFSRGSYQEPLWMVFTVSYLLVTFTDIPVCKQIVIMLVTKIDLNTMFFCNSIFDWQPPFAAC